MAEENEQSRLIVIPEWSGRYMIANALYEPVAKELVASFQELCHVHPKSILFVDDIEGKVKAKGKKQYAQIRKMPKKMTEIIHQISGRYFEYILELQKENMLDFTWEQIVMAIYRELRKIDAEGNIGTYDIEEFAEVAYNLGTDWNAKQRLIPNLLEAKGQWARMKQPRLFEPEEFLKNEKVMQ